MSNKEERIEDLVKKELKEAKESRILLQNSKNLQFYLPYQTELDRKKIYEGLNVVANGLMNYEARIDKMWVEDEGGGFLVEIQLDPRAYGLKTSYYATYLLFQIILKEDGLDSSFENVEKYMSQIPYEDFQFGLIKPFVIKLRGDVTPYRCAYVKEIHASPFHYVKENNIATNVFGFLTDFNTKDLTHIKNWVKSNKTELWISPYYVKDWESTWWHIDESIFNDYKAIRQKYDDMGTNKPDNYWKIMKNELSIYLYGVRDENEFKYNEYNKTSTS